MPVQPPDDLLPSTVPKRFGLTAAGFVALVLVGMAAAAIVGGVNWLIGLGGAGTALGTLGLAYFTFAVAERTTELVDSSQRLEAAAVDQLTAGRAQANAAEAAALEAEKSRIDALAPVLDFRVDVREVHAYPGGASAGITLLRSRVEQLDVKTLSLVVDLTLTLKNFGRTPAFATIKYADASPGARPEALRVDPGATWTGDATLRYRDTTHDPFEAREISYEIGVRGAMTRGQLDRNPLARRAYAA